MPGSISFNCETGRMMFAPLTVVLLHQAKFFGRQRPRLFQHTILDADFSDVVQQRPQSAACPALPW